MLNIKKEREAFENWFRTTEMYNVLIEYIATHQPGLKTVFIKSGKFYRNTMVNTSWVSWQASKQHEAQKLEGCVVVPVNNTTIVAVEKMVEQQVEASGITADVFRLDGEKILNAAVEAARGGNE